MLTRYDIYTADPDERQMEGDAAYTLATTVTDIGAALVQANRALMRGAAVEIVPNREEPA